MPVGNTPHACFRTANRSILVTPGGILGRMAGAALRLTDPRVSEAAALVSLRGRELHLLALRGAFSVDGLPDDDVVLETGQVVRLGDAVDLLVESVALPSRVLALAVPGQVRELCAPAYSILAEPTPDLVPAFVEPAVARAWSTAEGWVIDTGRGPERIVPGRSWQAGTVTVEARELDIETAAATPTIAGNERLTLVCRSTSVHIQRPRRQPHTLDGLPARLLTELGLMAAPAPWDVVAGELWSEKDTNWLRCNWDRTLRRLRLRLREGGVREDLVRADGRGNIELYLYPGDQVVDEA